MRNFGVLTVPKDVGVHEYLGAEQRRAGYWGQRLISNLQTPTQCVLLLHHITCIVPSIKSFNLNVFNKIRFKHFISAIAL